MQCFLQDQIKFFQLEEDEENQRFEDITQNNTLYDLQKQGYFYYKLQFVQKSNFDTRYVKFEFKGTHLFWKTKLKINLQDLILLLYIHEEKSNSQIMQSFFDINFKNQKILVKKSDQQNNQVFDCLKIEGTIIEIKEQQQQFYITLLIQKKKYEDFLSENIDIIPDEKNDQEQQEEDTYYLKQKGKKQKFKKNKYKKMQNIDDDCVYEKTEQSKKQQLENLLLQNFSLFIQPFSIMNKSYIEATQELNKIYIKKNKQEEKELTEQEQEDEIHNEQKNELIKQILLKEKFDKISNYTSKVEKVDFFNKNMNIGQQEIIKNCLNSNFLYLIQGPPGTGKTHTISELIRQLVFNHKKKVLVSAPSNNAIDNIMFSLIKYEKIHFEETKDQYSNYNRQLELTRIGNILKTHKEVEKYHIFKKSIQKYEDQKFQQLNSYQHQQQSKIKEKNKLSLSEQILESSDVVFLTLGNIAVRKYQKDFKKFDYVIIDEAGQGVLMSIILALQFGKVCILAGDQKQLPPTIKNQQNQNNHKTFFEIAFDYFKNHHEQDFYQTLTEQFRMNEAIMIFSSKYFYYSQLYANKSNQSIQLYSKKNVPIEPVILIDTSEYYIGEAYQNELQSSRFNLGEIKIIFLFYQFLETKFDIQQEDVGIISPYKEQCYRIQDFFKEKLNQKLIKFLPEIASVDSFQGREKTVILFSAVRSNPKQQIGFLQDERRMNVAITRAKKLFVLIGNTKTITQCNFLSIFTQILDDLITKKQGKKLELKLFDQKSFNQYKFDLNEISNTGVYDHSKLQQEIQKKLEMRLKKYLEQESYNKNIMNQKKFLERQFKKDMANESNCIYDDFDDISDQLNNLKLICNIFLNYIQEMFSFKFYFFKKFISKINSQKKY